MIEQSLRSHWAFSADFRPKDRTTTTFTFGVLRPFCLKDKPITIRVLIKDAPQLRKFLRLPILIFHKILQDDVIVVGRFVGPIERVYRRCHHYHRTPVPIPVMLRSRLRCSCTLAAALQPTAQLFSEALHAEDVPTSRAHQGSLTVAM